MPDCRLKQSPPVITITDADDCNTVAARHMDVENTVLPNSQLNLKNERVRRWPVVRVCIDILLLLFGWFGVSNILRSFGPYHRGFFCEDSTIRLPYRPNTVTVSMLFTYALGVPPLVILLTECFRLLSSASNEIYSVYEYGRDFSLDFYFMLALVTTEVATTVTKYSVVVYDLIISTCCLNGDTHKAQDGRLSFWSGHSALSLCAATFAVLYLQSRLKGQVKSLVLVPFLQLALLSSALYICYSRISDHMHHPTDVLVDRYGHFNFVNCGILRS
uniref:Phosphatidic acid phosphatase type 2/haloperoxidase domain-containing protein n=1 Tax=Ditylenchus dipsaci TaxID=166011 RepID=A0A915DFJ0_9BILA